jgi:hypothetical protein
MGMINSIPVVGKQAIPHTEPSFDENGYALLRTFSNELMASLRRQLLVNQSTFWKYKAFPMM